MSNVGLTVDVDVPEADGADSRAETLAEALGLDLPERTMKPRERGITMVMDQGFPNNFTEGTLAEFGEHLDVVKLWDPHLLAPASEVRRKIEIYREHDVIVQPGGLYLEAATKQGRQRQVLHRLIDLGFNAVEFSSTTSTRDDTAREAELIAEARELGAVVFGEVGRKFSDGDETRLTDDVIDIDATVHEFKELLAAGAWKVYWEGHLLRKVLGDDPESIKAHAGYGAAQVKEVVSQVGAENIIFEASGLRPRANRQWLQFWLVRLMGPQVNIGNARIEELANLEAIRSGMHPIFGFGNAGNYPWLRSLENSSGSNWWRG